MMTEPADTPQNVHRKIMPVCELLSLENLTIPDYQRPYKWEESNVTQLFQDIQAQHKKNAYRLGTIVFHRDSDNELNIVDGQQRTLTLMLAVKAIIKTRPEQKMANSSLCPHAGKLVERVNGFINNTTFDSLLSQQNLHNNYLVLRRIVSRSDFTEAHISFLLNKCQVVTFELHSVEEAFQFFDSQNSRGRDLNPHDLLKAFHLREFVEHEHHLKAATVQHWESLDSKNLASLFATYLFRIRQWSQGKSARKFTKNEVGLFKGVNIDEIGNYPFVDSLRITHHYVDEYNNQYQRKIDRQKLTFPFHLDQMIINGRRFFEMAEHYQQLVTHIVAREHGIEKQNSRTTIAGGQLSKRAIEILYLLNTYANARRKGDKYVRCMFDCAVIFYIDKFSTAELSQAIEKIFIWAYRCRVERIAVQLATMDNYVLNNNLFRIIREAINPQELLAYTLPSVTPAKPKASRSTSNKTVKKSPDESTENSLVQLFRDMKYCD